MGHSEVFKNFAKVDVVGPNPIARSNNTKGRLYGGFFVGLEWWNVKQRKAGSTTSESETRVSQSTVRLMSAVNETKCSNPETLTIYIT